MFAGTENFRFSSLLKIMKTKISKIVSEKTPFEVRTNHLESYFNLIYLNEHFLPRNNGNRFRDYSVEFFRNEIPFATLLGGTCLKGSLHKTFSVECPNFHIFFTSGLPQLQAFEVSVGKYAHCREG
jgi:hypothetical protein